jgi:hypothetical protein
VNNIGRLLVLKTTTLKNADEYVVVINEMNAVVVNVVVIVNVNQFFHFYYHYVK